MFDEKRTFGVEIEFLIDGSEGARRVVREMRQRGLECYQEDYNHVTRTWWKVTTDASVDGPGFVHGLEMVSPPLAGLDGMIQLQLACEALQAAGAKINTTCGLHVHHHAEDFENTTFANLAMMYLRFENTLDSIMSRSRRGNDNQYCQSITQWAGYRERYHGVKLEDAKDVDALVDFFDGDRYYKLNFLSYRAHSTIEFRQHQGTVEFPKIANWVVLTQTMVQRAIDRPVKRGKDGSWEAFKDFLGCNHNPNNKVSSYDDLTKAVYKFYNNRRRHFAQAA